MEYFVHLKLIVGSYMYKKIIHVAIARGNLWPFLEHIFLLWYYYTWLKPVLELANSNNNASVAMYKVTLTTLSLSVNDL